MISILGKRAALILCCLLAATGIWKAGFPEALAQPLLGDEYRVKGGFLYHFMRFTQWPAGAFDNADAPLVLCIASTVPESDILLALNDKVIRNRKVLVVKFTEPKDIQRCHVLFVASQDEKYVIKRLSDAGEKSILTVGEIPIFTQSGGVIRFFRARDQLRFEVNLDAADRAGLRFSSQMLMSAEIVRREK